MKCDITVLLISILYSLYLALAGGGSLFISGPFDGGGGGSLEGGGIIERGAYLFIQKNSDGDYIFELQ